MPFMSVILLLAVYLPVGGVSACIIGAKAFFKGYGVLMIVVFYLFRDRKWWCFLGQFLGLFWINAELIGGLSVPVEILGHEIFIAQQAMACLALIPIWLYKGKQGPHNKIIQYCFYAFYPVHMLILSLIALLPAA